MKNEAIKHHYIPQFILRNFSFNASGDIYYYDVESGEISIRHVSEIFMQKNLYRDEINHVDLPTQIENDLAKYEGEAAKTIKKFLLGNEITISERENESLLLFLAIMGLRSYNTFKTFYNPQSVSEEFYTQWQSDGNLVDFWKRNLGLIVNCRTIKEVLNHPTIDDPFKVFMMRDVFGYFGKYFIVLEKRGNEDFLIGVCYPVVISGDVLNLHMYDYYPLSPSRILIVASNGVEGAPQSVKKFKDDILKQPRRQPWGMSIHVKKIYEPDVLDINADIIKNSQIGLAFKDGERVTIQK
ncbi:MAG: DUF4238 domain-containing protein [Eubacteriales bacterium]|nr:DUF4238 domain-containing protein [Eubacteriales bacterium]